MSSGTCRALAELPPSVADLLTEQRRAVLGTIDDSGRPHLVPITFAVAGGEIVSAVDHKPKRTRSLARLRHIGANPQATLLIDRYSDDWSRLAWLMIRGRGRVEPPGTASAALAGRYPQYADRPPQGPVVVVSPDRITWWRAADGHGSSSPGAPGPGH